MPKPTQTPYTLADFLVEELRRRNLSQHEFADALKVDHSTISRVLSGKIKKPSLDFLEKLSEVTHVDLQVLVALVSPVAAAQYTLSPRILVIAQRLNEFPEAELNVFWRMANSKEPPGFNDDGRK